MKIISCPLCNSSLIDYKFHIERKYPLHQCNACDFMFVLPNAQIRIKSTNFSSVENLEEGKKLKLDRLRLSNSESYLQDIVSYVGKMGLGILELSCSPSQFSVIAKQKGFEIRSIFIDPVTFQLKEDESSLGNLKEFCLANANKYEICLLNDVVERVERPIEFLIQIRDFLKEEGILCIITPSLDSWSAKFQKNHWFEFRPEHVSYFNVQNIESTLVKSGYKDIITSENYRILDFDYVSKHFNILQKSIFSLFSSLFSPSSETQKRKTSRMIASGMITISKKSSLPRKPQLLSIVMPVFNEKATFEETLNLVIDKQLDKIDKEIIIVESNSTDGTRELVKKYEGHKGIRIIYEDKPRGKGHAVRTGLKNVLGDIILIQDADSEYDVDDYDALLEPLLNFQKMFVLGSRHTGDWKMRNFENRKFLSAIFNIGQILFTWMVNTACGSSMKDPFTMYKVFRKECMYGLEFEANRFDFDWEIVIKFLRKKYYPLEIPVNYSSRSYSQGKKVNIIKDPISWMKALIKYRFQKIKKVKSS